MNAWRHLLVILQAGPGRTERLPLVRKTLLISGCLVCICLWILAATVIVQIDSERGIPMEVFDRRVENLKTQIDRFCARRERHKLMRDDVRRILGEELSEESEAQTKKRDQALRKSLIFVRDLDQMWCMVPKAASTTWGNLLLKRLATIDSHKPIAGTTAWKKTNASAPPQVRLREVYKRVSSENYAEAVVNDSVKKILLVRHPFARVVSAFKDKLQSRKARTDGMYFFRSYGVKINRKYRKRNGVHTRKQKEPTFEEFIEYLIATDPLDYDEHWQPISIQCGLCQVRYDHIIRQEDLALMNRYHLKKLGFPPYLSVRRDNSVGGESLNLTSYFYKIPRRKMIQLFQKYRDDFHLFGYNFFDYYLPASAMV